jgi:DNA-binding phage protein
MSTEPADPFPVAELLREAVARARKASGGSQADVARAAGLTPEALCRALKDGSDARPSTVRAVLRVAGCKLVLRPEVQAPGPAR